MPNIVGCGRSPRCYVNEVEKAVTHAPAKIAGKVAGSVFDAVANEFADAAGSMLKQFATAWPKISELKVNLDGIDQVYALTTALGALVAIFVMVAAIIRSQISADGRYMGAAVVGLVKATVATMLTYGMVNVGAELSKEICQWIVTRTAGSEQKFIDQMSAPAGLTGNSGALAFLFGLVGIVVVLVLWAELLMIKVALAAVVATAPIGAGGLLSDTTAVWWRRSAWAAVRLLMVPPAITLCFALGFNEAQGAKGVESFIVALMTLASAVLCWPALARFFALGPDGQVSGGLGLLVGFAGGLGSRMSGLGRTSAGNPLDPVGLQRAGASSAGRQAGGGAAAAGGSAGFLPAAAIVASAMVGGLQSGLGRSAAHAGLGAMGESVSAPWLKRGSHRPTGSPGTGGAQGPTSDSSSPYAPPVPSNAPAAPAPVPAATGRGGEEPVGVPSGPEQPVPGPGPARPRVDPPPDPVPSSGANPSPPRGGPSADPRPYPAEPPPQVPDRGRPR